MKVVVVGGTGRIGSRVVDRLLDEGHEARAASRSLGVDTITRAGLPDAVRDMDVVVDVVDVVDAPTVEEGPARWYLETSTQRLLAAERAAGVRHHVALSMVGAERVDGGYLLAKRAQEVRVRCSGVPYTILRSTQTYELLCHLADNATDAGLVRLAPLRVQPVAADDVATAIARVAASAPLRGTAVIAGPEQFDLALVTQCLRAAGKDPHDVVVDHHARYLGAGWSSGDRSLLPDLQIAPTTLAWWLRTSRHHRRDGRSGGVPQVS